MSEQPLPLSPRQRAILALFGQGMTFEQIAARFGCGRRTVRQHVETARARLGARNAHHALVLAVWSGQIPAGGAR